MTPTELADEVEAVIRECRERVEGIGAQQYYVPGQPQKFETMPMGDLVRYAKEEMLDEINYNVMRLIRLDRETASLVRDRVAVGALNLALHALRQAIRSDDYGKPESRYSVPPEVARWFMEAFDAHWPLDDEGQAVERGEAA